MKLLVPDSSNGVDKKINFLANLKILKLLSALVAQFVE